jgi:hypothetical protein
MTVSLSCRTATTLVSREDRPELEGELVGVGCELFPGHGLSRGRLEQLAPLLLVNQEERAMPLINGFFAQRVGTRRRAGCCGRSRSA